MKVLSGDWETETTVSIKKAIMEKVLGLSFRKSFVSSETISLDQIATSEIISSDSNMSMSKKVGAALIGAFLMGFGGVIILGIIGAVLLGLVGAIIGAVVSGNEKSNQIFIEFKDGRRVVLETKTTDYAMKFIVAAGYQHRP